MSLRVRYLATTLVLVAVGLGYATMQGRLERPAPRLPARSAAGRPAALPPGPPTAREILERAVPLSLTADQKTRLETLDRQWRQESAEAEAALDEAEQDLAQYMQGAQTDGKASLQEVQHRSAAFRDRSAALRERRRMHADTAARLLTEAQRRTLTQAASTSTPGGDR